MIRIRDSWDVSIVCLQVNAQVGWGGLSGREYKHVVVAMTINLNV